MIPLSFESLFWDDNFNDVSVFDCVEMRLLVAMLRRWIRDGFVGANAEEVARIPTVNKIEENFIF